MLSPGQLEAAGSTSSPGPSSGESAGAAVRRRSLAVLRYLDVVLVVVAAPVALMLGAPAFGYAVGAGAWMLQRAVAVADRVAIARAAEPGSRLGLNFIDSFARIWLLAGGIVLAGAVGDHSDGLTAALVILAAYSVAFAVRIGRGREAGPS
jgi:hypothetical protein